MRIGLLEIFLLAFVVGTVITVFALILMFLLKGRVAKSVIFFSLAVWGMVLAWLQVLTKESREIMQQLGAWGIGSLSAIAMLVELCWKNDKKFLVSRILVLISVLLGIVGMVNVEIILVPN